MTGNDHAAYSHYKKITASSLSQTHQSTELARCTMNHLWASALVVLTTKSTTSQQNMQKDKSGAL